MPPLLRSSIRLERSFAHAKDSAEVIGLVERIQLVRLSVDLDIDREAAEYARLILVRPERDRKYRAITPGPPELPPREPEPVIAGQSVERRFVGRHTLCLALKSGYVGHDSVV